MDELPVQLLGLNRLQALAQRLHLFQAALTKRKIEWGL